MRTRLGVFFIVSVLSACLWGICAADLSAQEDTQSASAQGASSDKAEIQGQREAIKASAQAARSEEKAFTDQIRQAEQSGDYAAAKLLREQLRAMHQKNMQQKEQDMQAIKETRNEMKAERKEARFDKMDRNNDGVVDDFERRSFVPKKEGRDNNPPGPKGGPGTDWKNPPGPKGGPGAGPIHKGYRDNNPPGPKGGPGAAPGRKGYRDNDRNPPGPKG
ncbi:MAG: hypothetical protein KKH77_05930, partial [Candidatus Omnitrophica bacterium]|nr:hypothetical protein [Candidatus Omnitrophota bacterium]